MQEVSNLWSEFSDWLSLQMNLVQTQPNVLGREFASWLWNLSIWLNGANKGLIIALVLLVLIVNRILKRQH